MEITSVSNNLQLTWTRGSEYEITNWGGAAFIVPTETAVCETYLCADCVGPLVADALELGRGLRMRPGEQDGLCLEFAARYGLLGLRAEAAPHALNDPSAAPSFRPLNLREYGEDLSGFAGVFTFLYQHFLTTRGEFSLPGNPSLLDLRGLLHYRLTVGEQPRLIWEVRSLEALLRFAYAEMVSREQVPLKVCKNCGRVYFNERAR
ncbi:MAG: hypothetical protein IJC43_01420, partial [Clostridia bacterium]|nr:hypothetical protein [Clostridia bacterium]